MPFELVWLIRYAVSLYQDAGGNASVPSEPSSLPLTVTQATGLAVVPQAQWHTRVRFTHGVLYVRNGPASFTP